MNNRGFSLVELLAIITILGLIMGVAVVSQQKHVTKTRQAAYDTLITTARTAAQNRLIDEGIDSGYCKAYSIEELYTGGYMDKPADPASTSENCGGHVLIRSSANSNLIENYDIDVILECSTYTKEECKDVGGESCSYTEEEKMDCISPPLR
jgi:type IV pilus assembly protein PilA